MSTTLAATYAGILTIGPMRRMGPSPQVRHMLFAALNSLSQPFHPLTVGHWITIALVSSPLTLDLSTLVATLFRYSISFGILFSRTFH